MSPRIESHPEPVCLTKQSGLLERDVRFRNSRLLQVALGGQESQQQPERREVKFLQGWL